jgi:glycosyltransferase involved in cell wall biosynthesis
VVPNASDNDLFGANGHHTLPLWTQDKKLVLYTGTIGSMNDCWQIIRMAEHLQARQETGIEIVLIGDGKDRAELEAYANTAQLKNIRFLGIIPKAEVVAWLQQASCALLSFRAVACMDTVSPNKLFDAFASGVPIVQSTQGWIKQLLEREQCGITVPANDPKAMADAVAQLAHDNHLREKLAANASRVARELFDRDLLATKMRQILAEVVERSGDDR